MTLVETVIATALLGTALVMVTEGLTGVRRYANLGDTQDDLRVGALRIQREVGQDLCLSCWYFPDGATTYPATTLVADRALRYWPYVTQMQLPTTYQNGNFRHIEGRSSSLVTLPDCPAFGSSLPTDISLTPSQSGWTTSYYARSQELVFLRQTNGTWVADPANYTRSSLRFPTDPTEVAKWTVPNNHNVIGVKYASAWTRDAGGNFVLHSDTNTLVSATVDADADGNPDPYGVSLAGGVLKVDNGTLSVQVQFDSVDGTSYTMDSDQNQVLDATKVRDFQYAVVPSNVGLGRLVRAYKERSTSAPAFTAYPLAGDWISWNSANGGWGMKVDKVLSEDVTRVVFETYRQATDLAIDQVRLRLFMARKFGDTRESVLGQTISTVFTMRGRNSVTDMQTDATTLGTTRIPISY